MTHKRLDKESQKIICRSAVRSIRKGNPNHRLTTNGGESDSSPGSSECTPSKKSSKVPTVFIRSRQGEDPSVVKPMAEFDPDSLIGRTFLLPPQENGERLRAKVTKKVVEGIESPNINFILDIGQGKVEGIESPNINFILDIGQGKVEELITYNQLLDHLNRKISMILPLVSCCSCVNNPSSS